jgi:hypothetical protein
MDSGEAAGSGSAEQTQEDGFRLIVACVGGGNAVETVSAGGALKKSVAGAASGGFQRKMEPRRERSNILGFDGGIQRQLRRELTNESGVGFRVLAAKIVVEVEDEEHYAEAGSKFSKSSQQSYGVSAAADGEADSLAGMNEAMLAQGMFQRVEHRNII